MFCFGVRVVKMWSATQGCVALSTAEAEIYAMVQAGRKDLGARQLLHDLGWDRVSVEIRSDASAACSAIARKGVGAMKHVEIRGTWICGTWVRRKRRGCTHSVVSGAFVLRAGARAEGGWIMSTCAA